jgi:hypothetical protein
VLELELVEELAVLVVLLVLLKVELAKFLALVAFFHILKYLTWFFL